MLDPKLFLTWTCPRRATASRELKHIPIDVFDEIFSWLRPIHDPGMTLDLYYRTMARIAPVCHYFAYYSIRELSYNLNFNGESPSKTRTPTGTWCTGIIKRRDPMETLRKGIKTCAISNWIFPTNSPPSTAAAIGAFLRLFPPVIPRLENLRSMNLCQVPISQALFNSISRLRHLKDLYIRQCYLQKFQTAGPSSRVTPETPFPALDQLTIAECLPAGTAETPIADSFCLLASAPNLKVLTLAESSWFPMLRSHLSSDLLTLNLHLSYDSVPGFIAYLKTCAILRNLAVFLLDHDTYVDEEGKHKFLFHDRRITYQDRGRFRLAPEDLRNLQSFIGPLWLATMFLDTRPVSHLEFHFSQGHVSSLPPSEHEFGGLNPWYKPVACSLTVYPIDFTGWMDKLLTAGRDVIQVLSLPISRDTEMGAVSLPHLPNLLRLQVYFPVKDAERKVGFLQKALQGFPRLEVLHIYTNLRLGKLPYELSPGDQHHFVKKWGNTCATLSKVIYGSYMIWRRRRSTTSSGTAPSPSKVQEAGDTPPTPSSSGSSPYVVYHQWELEILSPDCVRERLELPSNRGSVRDWGGKLDALIEGSPFKNQILSRQVACYVQHPLCDDT